MADEENIILEEGQEQEKQIVTLNDRTLARLARELRSQLQTKERMTPTVMISSIAKLSEKLSPRHTIDITKDGKYDVRNYKYATINIPINFFSSPQGYFYTYIDEKNNQQKIKKFPIYFKNKNFPIETPIIRLDLDQNVTITNIQFTKIPNKFYDCWPNLNQNSVLNPLDYIVEAKLSNDTSINITDRCTFNLMGGFLDCDQSNLYYSSSPLSYYCTGFEPEILIAACNINGTEFYTQTPLIRKSDISDLRGWDKYGSAMIQIYYSQKKTSFTPEQIYQLKEESGWCPDFNKDHINAIRYIKQKDQYIFLYKKIQVPKKHTIKFQCKYLGTYDPTYEPLYSSYSNVKINENDTLSKYGIFTPGLRVGFLPPDYVFSNTLLEKNDNILSLSQPFFTRATTQSNSDQDYADEDNITFFSQTVTCQYYNKEYDSIYIAFDLSTLLALHQHAIYIHDIYVDFIKGRVTE